MNVKTLKSFSLRKVMLYPVKNLIKGHVNSPESQEMPEITAKTENFTKVIKYLTKLKETSIDYV